MNFPVNGPLTAWVTLPRSGLELLPRQEAEPDEEWDFRVLLVRLVPLRRLQKCFLQHIGSIDQRTMLVSHAVAANLDRRSFANASVMLAPAAADVKVFSCETRRIDQSVTGCAGVDLSMLGKLLADGGCSTNVRFDRRNAHRWPRRRRSE